MISLTPNSQISWKVESGSVFIFHPWVSIFMPRNGFVTALGHTTWISIKDAGLMYLDDVENPHFPIKSRNDDLKMCDEHNMSHYSSGQQPKSSFDSFLMCAQQHRDLCRIRSWTWCVNEPDGLISSLDIKSWYQALTNTTIIHRNGFIWYCRLDILDWYLSGYNVDTTHELDRLDIKSWYQVLTSSLDVKLESLPLCHNFQSRCAPRDANIPNKGGSPMLSVVLPAPCNSQSLRTLRNAHNPKRAAHLCSALPCRRHEHHSL